MILMSRRSWGEIAQSALLLVRAFQERGGTFSFAESCTGGLLGAIVTEIAGASSVFYGSVVSYSNEAKMEILGVPPSVIQNYGAVSRECAIEMALGALKAFKTTHALSVTGIAGPGGGSEEKPLGTVYWGIATHCGLAQAHHGFYAEGTRRRIRLASAGEALRLLSASLAAP